MQKVNGRLSILIIPGLFPFPPDDGGKICIFAFIDSLRDQHNIHLFLSIHNEDQKLLLESYRLKLDNVIIHSVDLINYAKPSFRDRIKKVINFFSKKRANIPGVFNDITFISPVSVQDEQFVFSLTKLMNEVEFDIIQTEYTSMLNLVNILPKNAKKIYVEIESRHSVLYDYGKAQNIDPVYLKYVCENAKNIELAYMKKYDAVFTLNEQDNIYLTSQLKGVKIFTSPFPVLDKDFEKKNHVKTEIDKIVFVGGEGHYPNYDAVVWFVESILPKINMTNNLKLYITGKWSSKTIKQLKAITKNVEFTGFINDIETILKSGISVIPIKIGGGGLRTKIIYSMAAGAPVVTTTLGAYGLIKEAQNAYLIADTAIEFVNQINRLISDKDLAQKLVENGNSIIQQFYSQKVVAEKRNSFYFDLLN